MDFNNVQSATRKGMKDFPEEMNIDFENDNKETLKNKDEELKKLGRQVED